MRTTPGSGAEGWDASEEQVAARRDPGFKSLEEMRGSAAKPVRVRGSGSDGFDVFVSYHVNAQPHAANKALMVALFMVFFDLLVNGAL